MYILYICALYSLRYTTRILVNLHIRATAQGTQLTRATFSRQGHDSVMPTTEGTSYMGEAKQQGAPTQASCTTQAKVKAFEGGTKTPDHTAELAVTVAVHLNQNPTAQNLKAAYHTND